jgi:histidine triad (HIT) family protein
MVSGKIPCNQVFENESILAFRDIAPKAPTHILVIPKKHIESINALDRNDKELAGEMLLVAQQITRDEGIDETGFRAVFNTNTHGGQTVFHIHMHLFGGRQMTWPPG